MRKKRSSSKNERKKTKKAKIGKKLLALAYDLGGTKVAVGVVDDHGKIIDELRCPVDSQNGKDAVIDQLAELGRGFLKEYPQIKRIGISSAGPLDPSAGILMDPTNMLTDGKGWGQVPIVDLLHSKLKRRIFLENDAAAAVLAENWVGVAKGYKNAIILTLGTGLGVGVICNNELVRSGRCLHPEGGHISLRAGDRSAPCGCGNLGCAEAYLSGRNFAIRNAFRFPGESLSAEDFVRRARSGNAQARAAFAEYAELMAMEIKNLVVLYAPEIVVFTGSFAEASDLFMDSTVEHLQALLTRRREGIDLMPKLKVSSLKNQAGLIGGAFVAFNKR